MTDYNLADKEYIVKLKEAFSRPDTRAMLTDRERLALLLSYTDCAKNLQHIMADIEEKFSSVRDVYRSSYVSIMQIDKMTRHGAYAILLVSKAMEKKRKSIKVFRTDSDYEKFFLSLLGKTKNEELWGVALDGDDKLIYSKKLSSGSACHVDIFTGDLIEFAVASGSHKIVIAHCHPYAFDTEMSIEDRNATDYLRTVLARFDISLGGHVVVSEGKAKFYKCTPDEKPSASTHMSI